MKFVLYSLLALLSLILIGARFGLFAGTPPNDLGVTDGRLKPPSLTRNSVSSQAALYPDHPQRDYAQIAPLPIIEDDAERSWKTLLATLATLPEITITRQQADYLQAEARTPWLGFVDDLEFRANPQAGMIEVRSASRLGREDFGVNRQRMERIILR
jgi:uncharacterized protein (DUF1499 family)